MVEKIGKKKSEPMMCIYKRERLASTWSYKLSHDGGPYHIETSSLVSIWQVTPSWKR